MRTISISLPDFATMTDAEMQAHSLSGSRDGRWSTLTKWLLDRFGTDRLELGEAWANSWTGWECPVCKRLKFEIARMTEQNVLLCQLDEHHDHLADHLKATLRPLVGRGDQETDYLQRRALASVFPLVERFAPILVCNDCNAADGAMKAALGAEIPSYFSFKPSEIASFILAAPNSSHDLDRDEGLRLWRHAKTDFEQRIAFAEMMTDRIAKGLHDRERLLPDRTRQNDMHMLYNLACTQLPLRNQPTGMDSALLARSISTDGRASATRKTSRRTVQTPTHDEFSAFDRHKCETSLPWRKAGDDWRCEVCERTKFETLRKSNNGGWTAEVRQFETYEKEIDPVSLRFRQGADDNRLIVGTERCATICLDCRQLVSDARTLVPEADHRCMSLDDIRRLIDEPAPHRRHDVGRQAIIDIVSGNREWIAAVADFLRHRNDTIDASLAHYRQTVNYNLPDAAARRAAIPELIAAGLLSPHDASERLDWLLRERRRLFPDD